jgi:2-amino-4-hydroxy-6-hydroxymethyldihydropteridine diphosphokinase
LHQHSALVENPSSISGKNTLYLLLGANLDDRHATFDVAKSLIISRIGDVVRESSRYETAPWGVLNQPSFLNQVVSVETALSPLEVLAATQQIETELGRVRHEHWGARTIDLDILYYNACIIDTKALRVPHPRLHLRRFTLIPLAEIAPDFLHPEFNQTSASLLANCTDGAEVVKLS